MPRQENPSHDEWPGGLRRPSLADLRSALWFWPAVGATVGFIVATTLSGIRPAAGTGLASWGWPGDRDSATAFLQVVAGSVITVTSLTFTLVVVALQLASQQFSPRLLREFARDLFTQLVLGILVTTFTIAVTVLRGLNEDAPLPAVALGLTFVMGLVSVMALLGFLGHIARLVRVDTMMAAVHRETRQVIERQFAPYDDAAEPAELPSEEHAAVLVSADKSGFVHTLDIPALVAAADAHDGLIIVGVRPGDHVVLRTPLARIAAPDAGLEPLVAAVHSALERGYERTLEQDAPLGLRQLTDIAVKALSPGINDPTTAGHALGHLGDLLVRLTGRRLGTTVHTGADGTPRVVASDHDLRYYLDLVVGPIRRYGAGEPTVLAAILRMLRDLAVSARDDEQREEIARQAELVVSTVDDLAVREDADLVRDLHRRVRMVLDGDVAGAYDDRAGETRSL